MLTVSDPEGVNDVPEKDDAVTVAEDELEGNADISSPGQREQAHVEDILFKSGRGQSPHVKKKVDMQENQEQTS